jgi:hypothetical protein
VGSAVDDRGGHFVGRGVRGAAPDP